MNKDIGTKVYELTIERQMQDRVIIQLRTECNELRSQLQKQKHYKSFNNENGQEIQQQIAGYERKLNRVNDQKIRFNNSKDKLIEAMLAILQNLRLECEGLKVSLLEALKQIASESMLSIINTNPTTFDHDNLREQYESEMSNTNDHMRLQQMKYQDQISSFQQKVEKLTYQLQDSEKNEMNLIAMNKKQLNQINDLKSKLNNVGDTRSIPMIQQLSRTTNDWAPRSHHTVDQKQKLRDEDIFASTLPLAWSNGSRSTSYFEQQEILKLKKSNDYLDRQFSSIKNELQPVKVESDFARATFPRITNDSAYYSKLTSKYLRRPQQ